MKRHFGFISAVLLSTAIFLSACYALGLFGHDIFLLVDSKYYESGEFAFSGKLKNGRFDGIGSIDLSSGESCNGGFIDGRLDGVFNYEGTGWQFAGTYTGEKIDGGTFYLADDTIIYENNSFSGNMWNYSGGLNESGQNGEGEFVFANGFEYRGSFLHGLANGEGVYTAPDGSIIYAGSFNNGLFDGYGLYFDPDGWSYEGSFKDGLFDGEGTVTIDNNTIHGVWEKGVQTTRYE